MDNGIRRPELAHLNFRDYVVYSFAEPVFLELDAPRGLADKIKTALLVLEDKDFPANPVSADAVVDYVRNSLIFAGHTTVSEGVLRTAFAAYRDWIHELKSYLAK